MARGMVAEGSLRSKALYKSMLFVLKIIPMLLALCDILNTLLYILGINLEVFSYIGGISVLTLIFLYLASYVFRFCSYHRMFLHYVTANNIISTIDYYYELGLPCTIYLITIGILLFGVLYGYLKEKKNEKST
jgi:hypothetical protein